MDYFIKEDNLCREYSSSEKAVDIMNLKLVSSGLQYNSKKIHLKYEPDEFFRLFFTLGGSAWVTERIKRKRAFRNDWTLLLPRRSSNLKSIGSWSFAFLVFAGKFPEAIVEQSDIAKKNDNLYFKQKSDKSELMLMKLVQKSPDGDFLMEAERNLLLAQLLISIIKNYTSKPLEENPLLATQKYIMQNLFNTMTLPELSAKANMSVPTFIRIFKQRMGDTPINLINKLRIDRAKEIIENHSEELKVNEIAKMIGFSDPFYFSRVFKKWTNLSPANYRKFLKEN
jgi:AraC-like DNA-binding protein